MQKRLTKPVRTLAVSQVVVPHRIHKSGAMYFVWSVSLGDAHLLISGMT